MELGNQIKKKTQSFEEGQQLKATITIQPPLKEQNINLSVQQDIQEVSESHSRVDEEDEESRTESQSENQEDRSSSLNSFKFEG